MMNIRKLAILGVSGAAGFSLIGMGSHATFTQTTASNQSITAGTMKVVLSEGTPDTSSTDVLTLEAFGPTGSSFTTGDQEVTITNMGQIAVNAIWSTPSVTYNDGDNNAALANQVYLCMASENQVLYNGPLHTAPAQPVNGPLAPAGTDHYTVNVYAGNAQTACGSQTTVGFPAVFGASSAPSLDNSAQGGVINPTITLTYTA